MDNVSSPTVSVVICTKNEESNVARCLQSLLNQEYPKDKLELIVVDNNSPDRTRDESRKYASAVYDLAKDVDLSAVKNYRGAQLNCGVRKSLGSVIFFPDADMTFDRGLVREATTLLEKYDALYVPEVVLGRGFFGAVRNFERSFYDATVIDAPRFVKKTVFEGVGGFDEKNIAFGFDDWDFAKSLKSKGFRLGLTVGRIYHHEERLALSSYLYKKTKYAQTFEEYVAKWGRSDADVRRQFSFWYRFFGVFIENGKWRRLISKPHLTAGLMLLRMLVGASYLAGKSGAVK